MVSGTPRGQGSTEHADGEPGEDPSASSPPRRARFEWHERAAAGSHPGDRYVRIARHVPAPRSQPSPVQVTAREEAPQGVGRRAFQRLKRVIIGQPLATAEASHERLTKLKALAVLSSDALSSIAYATEEIMRILLLAGTAALSVSLPIGAVIVILLFIVGFSYRQTIKAYPGGGGSYIVAKDNLGTLPGLTAAGSLLISYILTVSVSIAAGVAALTSAYPALARYDVAIGLGAIVLITLINLRGIRESGTVFMLPTYAFLACIGTLLIVGLARFGFGPPAAPATVVQPVEALTLFLILRAFSSGGAALTGVEAISDGVPAFKKPEWVNAQKTLTTMIVILAITFAGITYLANRVGAAPLAGSDGHGGGETVVSQIARAVFGESPMYYAVQWATFLILFLAANTAYADFPRLSYFLARDRFLPRQFTFRGDRLAFSVGIIVLGVASALVLWAFGGEISLLIPLYAFGVFSAFTWSQLGMVVRWWRRREPGWRTSIVFNAIGALATFVVLVIVATTKFFDGAWMVVVLLPILILMFKGIHAHYDHAAMELATETPLSPDEIRHSVLVPFAALNRVALQTLAYACSISPNVTAVHVVEDEDTEDLAALQAAWRRQVEERPFLRGVQLVLIESPYRSLVGPLLAYIDDHDRQDLSDTLTVILPEFVPAHWWENILHKQTALRLKAALLFRPGTIVASVPYHLRPGAKPPKEQAANGKAVSTE